MPFGIGTALRGGSLARRRFHYGGGRDCAVFPAHDVGASGARGVGPEPGEGLEFARTIGMSASASTWACSSCRPATAA